MMTIGICQSTYYAVWRQQFQKQIKDMHEAYLDNGRFGDEYTLVIVTKPDKFKELDDFALFVFINHPEMIDYSIN